MSRGAPCLSTTPYLRVCVTDVKLNSHTLIGRATRIVIASPWFRWILIAFGCYWFNWVSRCFRLCRRPSFCPQSKWYSMLILWGLYLLSSLPLPLCPSNRSDRSIFMCPSGERLTSLTLAGTGQLRRSSVGRFLPLPSEPTALFCHALLRTRFHYENIHWFYFAESINIENVLYFFKSISNPTQPTTIDWAGVLSIHELRE